MENDQVRIYLGYVNEPRNAFIGKSKLGDSVYTPRTSLLRYFQDGRASIDDLLSSVLKEEDVIVPVGSVVLQEYLLVFTVLLLIGKGQYLSHLIERNYGDDKLPFFECPRFFPKPIDGSFFEAFCNIQWRFCPVRLSSNPVNFHLESEQILPLRSKVLVKSDSTSNVFQVELHEEYDPFTKNGSQRVEALNEEIPLHRYTFKEFPNENRGLYDKELATFLYLQRVSSCLGKTIINFYGSFMHDDTCVLILEDLIFRDLDEYMSSQAPPSEAVEIFGIWEGLLRLPEAMHDVHTLDAPHVQETKRYSLLRGYHQKLNPGTIGLALGHSSFPSDLQARITDLGTNLGTAQSGPYDAPELSHMIEQQIMEMKSADIWSLGCVYSEFLTWLNLGLQGLKDYREARQADRAAGGLENTQAFHDGHRLLPCVRTFHEAAIAARSPNDTLTSAVLDQVVDEMLCEDSAARPNARLLKMKIGKIMARTRERHYAMLQRNDSTTSSNSSYSAYTKSVRGPLSYATSVKSYLSVPSPTARMEDINLVRRSGPDTDGSANPCKTLQLSTAPEQDSTTFVTQPNSPQTPGALPPLSYFRPPSSCRTLSTEGSILELEGNDLTVLKPTALKFSQNQYYKDMTNGEEKELVVSGRASFPYAAGRIEGRTISSHSVGPDPSTRVPSRQSQASAAMTSPELLGYVGSRSPTEASSPECSTGRKNESLRGNMDIRPDNDPLLGVRAAGPDPLDTHLSQSSGDRHLQNGTPQASCDIRDSTASPNSLGENGLSEGLEQAALSITQASIVVYKPYLSLLDGLIWLNQKKGSASSATLRDEGYLNALAGRDFAFLVDDSGSMRAHREMTSRAVRLLSWLLKKYDKNGVDLYFTQRNDKTHARPGHSSDLQRPLLKQLDICSGISDPVPRLMQIVQEYRDRSMASSPTPAKSSRGSFGSLGSSKPTRSDPKKVIVFVVTDGRWAEGTEFRLAESLRTLAATLKLQNAPEQAIGVQFVYTEPAGPTVTKMKAMQSRDYTDRIVVDAEYLEGNVFRLLLGTISDLWISNQNAIGMAM